MPLSIAFWSFAIFWGALLNLATTIASLALLVIGNGSAPSSWAAPMAVALHLLPIPYAIVAFVGVWRSAARPEVTSSQRLIVRCTVAIWTAGMILI